MLGVSDHWPEQSFETTLCASTPNKCVSSISDPSSRPRWQFSSEVRLQVLSWLFVLVSIRRTTATIRATMGNWVQHKLITVHTFCARKPAASVWASHSMRYIVRAPAPSEQALKALTHRAICRSVLLSLWLSAWNSATQSMDELRRRSRPPPTTTTAFKCGSCSGILVEWFYQQILFYSPARKPFKYTRESIKLSI